MLRSKPTECRGVDELLQICVEMSRHSQALSNLDDLEDRTPLAADQSDSGCFYETSVDNSTSCWYNAMLVLTQHTTVFVIDLIPT